MTAKKTTTPPAAVPLDREAEHAALEAAFRHVRVTSITDDHITVEDRDDPTRTYKIAFAELTARPRHGGRAEVTPDGQRADMP
jgi:hypothetical protein